MYAIQDPPRGEIIQVLEQIADAVTPIPPSSAFWDSMKSSLLQIDISGFRVVYRIESDPRQLRVIELQQIPR